MRQVTMFSRLRLLTVAVLFQTAVPAFAHHSVTGIFDVTKTIEVTGRISKLEWINPHSYLFVDVQEGGQTVTYAFETLPPAMMRRAGVNREALLGGRADVGQTVTVKANPAKADPRSGWITLITYPDGHSYQLAAR
jgi:hypothetical protein